MFFISNRQATVFILLTVIRGLVSISLNHMEDKPQVSVTNIVDYVTLPWMEGRDWILHSSESSQGKEVRAFIRGVESGKIWALQKSQTDGRNIVSYGKRQKARNDHVRGVHVQIESNVATFDARHLDVKSVLDALLKIQREIPQRNIQEIGIYDECIDVNAQHNHISIRTNSCKIASSELDLGASGSSFTRVKSKEFTTVEFATIIFFLTIGVFMIACTICDMVTRINSSKNLSKTINTMSKFSLYTNALATLSTKVTPDMMPAIHGIRCLSCVSVVIGHRYMMSTFALRERTTLLDLLEWKNSWIGVYVEMTLYAVDTFLVIGGFLISLLFFKSMNSGIKLDWTVMYVHRYFRITPCLAVCMLFATIFSHRIGSGPLWESAFAQTVNHCSKTWWLYFLYSQNLVANGNACLGHFWYIAVFMQLFWISPVILYAIHRWPKFGLGVLSFLFATSVITPTIILAINNYSNAVLRIDVTISRYAEILEHFYIPTYNRACPYLVGIFLGYDVVKKKRHLTPVNVAINWLLSGSLILFCVWATNRTFNSNFTYNLWRETAFAALLIPCWSIAVSWIIYACIQGYGGLVTRFLSLPLFFPLSRLTYCIYMVHPGIQAIAIVPYQIPANYLGFEMLYGICSDLVLSTAVAFVMHLFIERPAITLMKILTNDKSVHLVREPTKKKKK